MGIQAQAFRDLFNRYKTVFAHVWARRDELEPLKRTRHEYEFLPATLALQETPVHPAPKLCLIVAVKLSNPWKRLPSTPSM
jgi:hemolysin D